MRIGLVLEEIINPRMKQSASLAKIFKALNNTYIQDVFDSMNETETQPAAPEKREVIP